MTGFVAGCRRTIAGALLQPRFQMRAGIRCCETARAEAATLSTLRHSATAYCAQSRRSTRSTRAFRTILAPALQDVEQRLGRAFKVDYTKDYDLPEKTRCLDRSCRFTCSRLPAVPALRMATIAGSQAMRDHLRSGFAGDQDETRASAWRTASPPRIADEACGDEPQQRLRAGVQCRRALCPRLGRRHAELGRRSAAPGWLQKLIRPLMEQRSLGAIGPKLIFETDRSNTRASTSLSDQRGICSTSFPQGHAATTGGSTCPQRCPASPCVPGDAREVYELVDGYTEDYVMAIIEDSDLCLKNRRCGYDIAYERRRVSIIRAPLDRRTKTICAGRQPVQFLACTPNAERTTITELMKTISAAATRCRLSSGSARRRGPRMSETALRRKHSCHGTARPRRTRGSLLGSILRNRFFPNLIPTVSSSATVPSGRWASNSSAIHPAGDCVGKAAFSISAAASAAWLSRSPSIWISRRALTADRSGRGGIGCARFHHLGLSDFAFQRVDMPMSL